MYVYVTRCLQMGTWFRDGAVFAMLMVTTLAKYGYWNIYKYRVMWQPS